MTPANSPNLQPHPPDPAQQRYEAQHLAGSGAGPDERVPVRRRRRFSRHQRVTITKGILLFVITLVLCQLWLFTATLNAYLGGDRYVIWPGAIASLACLGLILGLLRYLRYLEAPAAPTDTGLHP